MCDRDGVAKARRPPTQSLLGVVTAPDDEAGYEALIRARANECGWSDWKMRKVPMRRPGVGHTTWLTPTSRPGFPDLFLVHPAGWVLMLEVKGKGGSLKPEQRELIQMLQATADAIGDQRFAAYAVWPKDWPAVERHLARPAESGRAVSEASP